MQREVRPARGDGGAVTAKAQWAINYVTLDKMAWRTAPVLVPFIVTFTVIVGLARRPILLRKQNQETCLKAD